MKKLMEELKNKLVSFHNKKIEHSLLRYLKVITFHVFFEMLITAYSMELITILTRFFILDPQNINQLFAIMIVPTIVSILVATVFSVCFTVFFIYRLYQITDICKSSCINATMEKYRKDVIIVHIIGILFYTIASLGISSYLFCHYPSIFLKNCHLIQWMTIIGAAFGLIWNITGIYRDQRVLWNVLIPQFDTPEATKKITDKNYTCYFNNLLWNTISLFVVFGVNAFIFLTINDKTDIKALTTDYWFLIMYYFSLIVLYVKYIFVFLYSNINLNEAMFSPLSSIIKQENI